MPFKLKLPMRSAATSISEQPHQPSAAQPGSPSPRYQISDHPIAELKPSSHNARSHSPKQISQIAASIRRFGFLSPVLIDATGMILAGHGRVEAAQQLGMTSVPVVQVEHLTPAEQRAFMLADNKIAHNSGWDEVQLAEELRFLTDVTVELDFDVEITGFETPEIDLLLDGSPDKKPKADKDDQFEIAAGPAVTQLGDLWELGPHRLFCGDALERDSYARLMQGDQAQLVVSDVPYNVTIAGHVSGSGRHREFAMASGEMSDEAFTSFLRSACVRMSEHCQDGALAFLFIDWRHWCNLLEGAREAFSAPLQMVVWNKLAGAMGTFYRSQHELIGVFKKGLAKHINTFGLGEKGRYRTNVWSHPGMAQFGRGRKEALAMHPTVKPVALIADALRDCSHRKGLVLDPFSGSGTILIAAEKTGRIARAIELDPLYVDTAVQRWESKSGQSARHVETGLTFAELKAKRRPPGCPAHTPLPNNSPKPSATAVAQPAEEMCDAG